ncbi:reverse transcriptase domain-containing protein [Tanacetum coccineum]
MTSTGTTRLQDTIRMANSLMDQKVRAIATRDADSKRKWEDEHEGNHRQQQNKRQEAGRNVDHQARDYSTPTSVTCYGCEEEGHAKRYCPGMEN